MSVDKSKYLPVGNTRTDRSWPETGENLSVGDSIEGVYTGKDENVGANDSNVYKLQTEEGELVGVWGSTVLDARMEGVEIGSEVAIEFIGLKTPKKGGKPYKDFFVGVVPRQHGETLGASSQRQVVDDDIPF